MNFFSKKKENVASENINPPESTSVVKGVSSMNANQSVVLAYRTEDDLRSVCRKEIETLEHWTRRLVHETLTAHYGDVPLFIRATDSLGNVFLPEKEGFPLKLYVDLSKPIPAKIMA